MKFKAYNYLNPVHSSKAKPLPFLGFKIKFVIVMPIGY